jgi:hypothetical protein
MLNKQLENLEKFMSTTINIEPKDEQPLMQAVPFQMQQQQPMLFQQPMMQPMLYGQPPIMYAGQPQQPSMIYQTIPLGYHHPQMMQQGHPPIHPPHQQF